MQETLSAQILLDKHHYCIKH